MCRSRNLCLLPTVLRGARGGNGRAATARTTVQGHWYVVGYAHREQIRINTKIGVTMPGGFDERIRSLHRRDDALCILWQVAANREWAGAAVARSKRPILL